LNNPRIDYIAGSTRVVYVPQINQKIRSLVEQELNQNGYAPSPDSYPDFFVTFYAKKKDQDWVSSWSGTTPSVQNVPVVIFPGYERTGTRRFQEGMVYLTLYDSKTKRPSWTGSVQTLKLESDVGKPEDVAAVEKLVEELRKTT
jgi:hypothetical protein